MRGKKRVDGEFLPSGIVHHWNRDPDNSKKTAVTCLLCDRDRYVYIPRGKQREEEGFTGACHPCGNGRRIDDWEHPSGAILLFSERDIGKPDEIPFKCSNLKCRKRSNTWSSSVYDPKWLGRCDECLRKCGHPLKKTGDVILKDGPGGTGGTELLFSQEDEQGLIPVVYRGCKHTRKHQRTTALAYLNANRCPRLCRECYLNFDAIIERLLTQNGNGQKNGGAGKSSHGGARNVKWTPTLRAEYLALYESTLEKVRKKDQTLPEEVREKASLRGNKPSEVARDYAAQLLTLPQNSYLILVITEARRERAKSLKVQDAS